VATNTSAACKSKGRRMWTVSNRNEWALLEIIRHARVDLQSPQRYQAACLKRLWESSNFAKLKCLMIKRRSM